MLEIMLENIECIYETLYADENEYKVLTEVSIRYLAKTESSELKGASKFNNDNNKILTLLMVKNTNDPYSLRKPSLIDITIAEYEKIIKEELSNLWR